MNEQRITASFAIKDTETFKQQMLNWANQFSICCFLDNHSYISPHHSYDWLLAADAYKVFSPKENILAQLHSYYAQLNDWVFGHFNYDLKNEIENLSSSLPDNIQFPEIFLFLPVTVIYGNGKEVVISCIGNNPQQLFEKIIACIANDEINARHRFNIQQRVSRSDYISTVQQLQKHILRGDCYEINYCIEFFAQNEMIAPVHVYKQLSDISPNPFSCYYKLYEKYLLCASPERFLKKEGSFILSQPIKGTAKRKIESTTADEENKIQLLNSAKDKSENVMVVDLVRNDLSRICRQGTVKVDELFGVYSFPQVHQMISTVSGELNGDINLADILRAAFPMGSMTGAPKKKVMELIEQYEQTKRGIFSGAVGYITPEKNFDFNVVIRSIMHNAANKYTSYMAGSGITFYSNAADEYEECLLKAKAIEEVLC